MPMLKLTDEEHAKLVKLMPVSDAVNVTANLFAERHPEFVQNKENGEAMSAYMLRHHLSFTSTADYEKAFAALTKQGKLKTTAEIEAKMSAEEYRRYAAETGAEPVKATPGPRQGNIIRPPSTRVFKYRPTQRELAMMNAPDYEAALEQWPELNPGRRVS